MELSLERMMNELRNGNEENSILESLFELWIDQNPAYDEKVRQLYEELGEWMNHMSLEDSERLTGIIAELCVAYSHTAFLDGAKIAGQLMQEILKGNKRED